MYKTQFFRLYELVSFQRKINNKRKQIHISSHIMSEYPNITCKVTFFSIQHAHFILNSEAFDKHSYIFLYTALTSETFMFQFTIIAILYLGWKFFYIS